MKRSSACVFLLLAACGDASKGAGSLRLELGASDTDAGTAVPARLVYTAGDESREVEGVVRSEQEPGLTLADGALVPTLAAEHALTAIADVDGESFTATGTLLVRPGPAAELNLVLDGESVEAGGAVGWTLSGADAYGNDADLVDAVVDGGESLSVERVDASGTVGGTVAGAHTVTATLGAASDTAPLAVLAGPPVSLELELERDTRSAVSVVTILDAFGNSADADWELACDGVCSCPTPPAIPYDAEGLCTVTATVPDAGLSDTYGPFVVDWSGPALTVESPDRGAWFDPGTITVRGTAPDVGNGLAGVTVNGVSADLAGDTWSVDVALPFGPTILETIATDAGGRTSSDVRTVLAGERVPFESPLANAVVFRLAEGEGGLDVLGDMVASGISSDAITASLPDPLMSESERVCVGWYCYTVDLEATVTDVSWSAVDVVFDPQSNGTLVVDIEFTDVELPWVVSGDVSDSGTGTADELVVSLVIEFSVAGDAIAVEVVDVEVSTTAFDLGLSSDIDTILGILGYDLEAEAQDQLEAAVEDNLASEMEDQLEDAFADLSLDERWAVGDTEARAVLKPSEVAVDADGIDIRMQIEMSLAEWMIDAENGGAPYYGYALPTWSSLTAGSGMALSVDATNLLFYAKWGAGQFRRQLGIDEFFEVDITTFSAIFPGVSDPVLTMDAEAPAMLVPREDGTFDFTLSEVRLDIYDGEAIEGAEVYTVYMSTNAEGEFLLGDEMIDVDWGRPTAYVDIVLGPEELSAEDAESLQSVLESVVSGLFLDENRHLGGLYLPVIGGYGLVGTGVFEDGADHGYVVAEGDFAAL